MGSIAKFFVKVNERYLPDPFLFAIVLTVVTFILSLIFTSAGVLGTLNAWGNGIWALLAFTAQMASIMVFAYAFARTEIIEKGLRALCNKIKTPSQAYFVISFTAAVISWLCWPAGLICGAFMAKEMAKRIRGIHYPLLVAAAYSGFLIFQLGLTGSVSLLSATPGNFAESIVGIVPVSLTMFAPWNLFTAVLIGLIVVPFMMMKMAPKPSEVVELDTSTITETPKLPKIEKKGMKPNEILENSYFCNLIIGGGLGIYLILHFIGGGSLTINSTNLIFVILGILLTPTPVQYVRNCFEGASTVGGVIMQFPLYAGIQGMMLTTGLASVIAGWFVAISTPMTFPLWSFISAGLINMFIPSGGSQWAVQGPIMLQAAVELGADIPRVIQAVAYGDNWTNMIQPFWALPLLAVAGMKAKDIMGYLVLVLLVSGVIFGGVLVFWPY